MIAEVCIAQGTTSRAREVVSKELNLRDQKPTLGQTHSKTMKTAELQNFLEMNYVRRLGYHPHTQNS